MTHSYGYRRKTRSKFAQAFRHHGAIRMQKYLTTYKRGDVVDIVCDGSQQKGLPYKLYHGRTGTVFNVNPHSIGVIIKKQVRHRQIEKRIHIRVEHLRRNNGRDAWVARINNLTRQKTEAKKEGKTIQTKRQPQGPREGGFIKPETIEFQQPKAFREIF
ncbi:Translation protein SH3-like domain [Pseudocohnilembus persalinus]|uniref:Translation protein SH3-like domain n=1 Tax=Pseudocohnilembus persalinus TaxID=266149 RepID=A0A0V0QYR5_PSEPJ|nr:Translation protein SH3-like domain [Pseudocohnilembus persalinus]|eukprot:KRX07213.1 Translation protein SH3-like domain [Pseudocohnilembus persalinus]